MIKKFYERYLKDNADIILSIVIAAVFYISVFGLKTLNPANYKWIMKQGGDLVQNYLGGVVYRASPWSWPPFSYKSIGHPYGVSVLNTDSLPIMAILFKCLTTIFGLSPKYQFIGLWIFTCFILQAFFAARILRKIFSRKCYIVMASIFFIVSPTIIFRAFSHSVLCGHWLILASILLYLNDRLTKKEWFYFSLIEVLSTLVHPYFLPMTFPLLLALAYKKLFQDREISFKNACLGCGAMVVALLATLYLLDAFETINPVDGGGWSHFSMNLNAPINPMSYGSLFLNALATQPGQYEGYNYLGFGLIILLILLARDLFSMLNEENLKSNAGILIVCLSIIVFSLSNDLYIGKLLIFSYKFVVTKAFGTIFRSGGRMFWPVGYLLTYLLLRRLNEKYREKVYYILPIVCLIQLADLAPLYMSKGTTVRKNIRTQESYKNPLDSEEWNKLFATYKHVFITKVDNIDNCTYSYFWEKIIDSDIVVNGGYLTKISKKMARNTNNTRNTIMSGYLPWHDTIYVIDEELYEELSKNSSSRLFSHIQSLDNIRYILFDRKFLNREDSINFNKKLYFNNDPGKYISLDGFSSIDEPEYWSQHHEVSIEFRLGRLPKGDFMIKFDVVPFTNEKNKTVRAKVFVNGKKLAKWVFKDGKQHPRTNLRVPRNLLNNGDIVEVKFRLRGIKSMKKLRLGTDSRRKGIGLVSLELEELNAENQN
ncbi:MAG: DUF6311 domain-containing protein [Rickettsiales bacterium]|jgi:hypothetical protein|nr:DUF6311 domain-containing protein [Rickettsiales bacterium]